MDCCPNMNCRHTSAQRAIAPEQAVGIKLTQPILDEFNAVSAAEGWGLRAAVFALELAPYACITIWRGPVSAYTMMMNFAGFVEGSGPTGALWHGHLAPQLREHLKEIRRKELNAVANNLVPRATQPGPR